MQLVLKKVRKFFMVCINVSCLVFVIWQSVQCIQHYMDAPISVTFDLKKTADLPFPDITVCGSFGKEKLLFVGLGKTLYFNQTYLKENCEIYVSENYIKGEWRNNNPNCTDAKKLFEDIVFKPEDVIKKVGIAYWSTSKFQSYNYLQSKDQWKQYDSRSYGRCFTFKASSEQIKKEIWTITLELGVDSTVITHTPGMFLTQPENKMTFNEGEVTKHKEVKVSKTYTWAIKYDLEHHDLLFDYKGDVCNDTKQYMKDFCVDKAIEKESIKKVGCTTPYGPNKSQICNNKNDADAAYKIYHDKGEKNWDDTNSTKECLNPCSIFTFKTETNEKKLFLQDADRAVVYISFARYAKETTHYYIYTGINLIGEVGGYVGLFLGISINQVIYLMDFIGSRIKQLHDIYKS